MRPTCHPCSPPATLVRSYDAVRSPSPHRSACRASMATVVIGKKRVQAVLCRRAKGFAAAYFAASVEPQTGLQALKCTDFAMFFHSITEPCVALVWVSSKPLLVPPASWSRSAWASRARRRPLVSCMIRSICRVVCRSPDFVRKNQFYRWQRGNLAAEGGCAESLPFAGHRAFQPGRGSCVAFSQNFEPVRLPAITGSCLTGIACRCC